jgi:hypothetical protein
MIGYLRASNWAGRKNILILNDAIRLKNALANINLVAREVNH